MIKWIRLSKLSTAIIFLISSSAQAVLESSPHQLFPDDQMGVPELGKLLEEGDFDSTHFGNYFLKFENADVFTSLQSGKRKYSITYKNGIRVEAFTETTNLPSINLKSSFSKKKQVAPTVSETSSSFYKKEIENCSYEKFSTDSMKETGVILNGKLTSYTLTYPDGLIEQGLFPQNGQRDFTLRFPQDSHRNISGAQSEDGKVSFHLRDSQGRVIEQFTQEKSGLTSHVTFEASGLTVTVVKDPSKPTIVQEVISQSEIFGKKSVKQYVTGLVVTTSHPAPGKGPSTVTTVYNDQTSQIQTLDSKGKTIKTETFKDGKLRRTEMILSGGSKEITDFTTASNTITQFDSDGNEFKKTIINNKDQTSQAIFKDSLGNAHIKSFNADGILTQHEINYQNGATKIVTPAFGSNHGTSTIKVLNQPVKVITFDLAQPNKPIKTEFFTDGVLTKRETPLQGGETLVTDFASETEILTHYLPDGRVSNSKVIDKKTGNYEFLFTDPHAAKHVQRYKSSGEWIENQIEYPNHLKMLVKPHPNGKEQTLLDPSEKEINRMLVLPDGKIAQFSFQDDHGRKRTQFFQDGILAQEQVVYPDQSKETIEFGPLYRSHRVVHPNHRVETFLYDLAGILVKKGESEPFSGFSRITNYDPRSGDVIVTTTDPKNSDEVLATTNYHADGDFSKDSMSANGTRTIRPFGASSSLVLTEFPDHTVIETYQDEEGASFRDHYVQGVLTKRDIQYRDKQHDSVQIDGTTVRTVSQFPSGRKETYLEEDGFLVDSHFINKNGKETHTVYDAAGDELLMITHDPRHKNVKNYTRRISYSGADEKEWVYQNGTEKKETLLENGLKMTSFLNRDGITVKTFHDSKGHPHRQKLKGTTLLEEVVTFPDRTEIDRPELGTKEFRTRTKAGLEVEVQYADGTKTITPPNGHPYNLLTFANGDIVQEKQFHDGPIEKEILYRDSDRVQKTVFRTEPVAEEVRYRDGRIDRDFSQGKWMNETLYPDGRRIQRLRKGGTVETAQSTEGFAWEPKTVVTQKTSSSNSIWRKIEVDKKLPVIETLSPSGIFSQTKTLSPSSIVTTTIQGGPLKQPYEETLQVAKNGQTLTQASGPIFEGAWRASETVRTNPKDHSIESSLKILDPSQEDAVIHEAIVTTTISPNGSTQHVRTDAQGKWLFTELVKSDGSFIITQPRQGGGIKTDRYSASGSLLHNPARKKKSHVLIDQKDPNESIKHIKRFYDQSGVLFSIIQLRNGETKISKKARRKDTVITSVDADGLEIESVTFKKDLKNPLFSRVRKFNPQTWTTETFSIYRDGKKVTQTLSPGHFEKTLTLETSGRTHELTVYASGKRVEITQVPGVLEEVDTHFEGGMPLDREIVKKFDTGRKEITSYDPVGNVKISIVVPGEFEEVTDRFNTGHTRKVTTRASGEKVTFTTDPNGLEEIETHYPNEHLLEREKKTVNSEGRIEITQRSRAGNQSLFVSDAKRHFERKVLTEFTGTKHERVEYPSGTKVEKLIYSDHSQFKLTHYALGNPIVSKLKKDFSDGRKEEITVFSNGTRVLKTVHPDGKKSQLTEDSSGNSTRVQQIPNRFEQTIRISKESPTEVETRFYGSKTVLNRYPKSEIGSIFKQVSEDEALLNLNPIAGFDPHLAKEEITHPNQNQEVKTHFGTGEYTSSIRLPSGETENRIHRVGQPTEYSILYKDGRWEQGFILLETLPSQEKVETHVFTRILPQKKEQSGRRNHLGFETFDKKEDRSLNQVTTHESGWVTI